jgi:hypothetical protein
LNEVAVFGTGEVLLRDSAPFAKGIERQEEYDQA